MQEGGKWSQVIIFLGQHNRQEKDNLNQGGSLRTRKVLISRSIDHAHLHRFLEEPQALVKLVIA